MNKTTTVITDYEDIMKLLDEGVNDKKKKELENFLKTCEKNPSLLFAICSFSAISGHSLDPECCAPVEKELLQGAMTACVERILEGCKVNGKDGHFSCGGMGSRWLDLNRWAKSVKLDYVRCAFYSKKFSEEWKQEKPYSIQITVEKSR
jgi:hypothetical protein